MIKIAVVDDEKIFLEMFREKLEKEVHRQTLNGSSIVTFQSGTDFLPHIDEYDVIFLDVDMPCVSGKDIAMQVRERSNNPLVIFVTNYDNFVFSSFKYKPFEFIRKRYIDKELPDVVNEILNYFWKNNCTYTFNFNGILTSVNQHDIVYFEVYGHQIYINTVDRQYIINEPLSQIEKKVSERIFVKTHKSYLVNVKYIYSVEKDRIILNSKKPLPLSRHRINEVKQRMITTSRR